MILASIDTYIVGRLQKVKVNGVAASVYGPGDVRSFGATELVCYAVSRVSALRNDLEQYATSEVFTPSVAQQTITNPYPYLSKGYGDDSESFSGPESYTLKGYPIPVSVDYQIDVLASKLSDRDYLEIGLMEAMPAIQRPTLIDQLQPLIIIEEDSPVIMDELEHPLFRTVHRYSVRNIWLQRTKGWTVPSIQEIQSTIGLLEET